jgi:ribosomal-protein-serine acetyltransferase
MFYLAINGNIHVHTLHPDNADLLFQLVERNRSRLRPWIHPSALPETITAARKLTIEAFFNSLANSMDAILKYYDYFQELDHYIPLSFPTMEMGIWLNDSLVGEIMLGRLQDSYSAAEFGYWLDSESEGQGIITRCVSGLMDFAIDNIGTSRFIIGCAVDNHRSRAIPERLGYRLQAIVPGGEIVGDYIYDRAIYEMRSAEWRERDKYRMIGSFTPGE